MEKRAFFSHECRKLIYKRKSPIFNNGTSFGEERATHTSDRKRKLNQLFKTHQPFLWAELKIYYQSFSATAPDWLPILPRYRRALLRSHFYWRLTGRKDWVIYRCKNRPSGINWRISRPIYQHFYIFFQGSSFSKWTPERGLYSLFIYETSGGALFAI